MMMNEDAEARNFRGGGFPADLALKRGGVDARRWFMGLVCFKASGALEFESRAEAVIDVNTRPGHRTALGERLRRSGRWGPTG